MKTAAPQKDRARFNLSAWALANQSLVIFMMVLIVLAGGYSYTKLSRGEDPPFTIKTMVVAAYWPGASGEDMTNLVTDRLEDKLEEIAHLDRLDSYTRPGESVIMLHLRDDTPPSMVSDIWYSVRKKVGDIAHTLPQGVYGPFFNDEFDSTFGLIYGFTREGISQAELRDYVDDARAQILTLPAVGKVNLIGVQEEQIRIEFSPARLAAYGLDGDAIAAELAKQNAIVSAGTARLPDEKISLRVSGAFTSEDSLREITLRAGNSFVPLTDLVTITRVPADPPAPLYRVDGEEAIGLAISMAPGGNLLDFGKAVAQRIDEIQSSLPHGVEITQVADQGVVVKDAIKKFLTVLAEAIAIVIVVSFLSLGLRAGLVVMLSIPLVLAMTFICMEITGIGLQRISLGALIIALGLLVDDAMITVEAMVERLEHGWDRTRAASYAYETTAFPMLTGTLVMVAGFIPVGLAAGSAGEYTFSLFMIILISLMASWIVAVLFAPVLGTWILPAKMEGHDHKDGRVMRMFKRGMEWSLRRPWTAILGAVLALVLSLAASGRIEQQFFPASDRPELLISMTLPQNASLDATDRVAKRLEEMLADDPAVERFSTYVGAGAIRFYLAMDVLLDNENVTQTVVVAKDLKARDELKTRLDAAFRDEFADITTRVNPLELGPPVGWPMRFRVTGPDINQVREYAMRFANLLDSDPATRDVNLTSGEPQKTVRVEVHQDLARAVGISSEDVASLLASIYSGAPVTTLRDGNRLVDVVLRANSGERRDLATVENLQIAVDGTRSVPLPQIATISWGVEEPIIWRRSQVPIITVQADVAQGVQASTVSARLAPLVAEFNAGLPPDYNVEEGGMIEEAAKGNASIMAVIPLMLVVMASLLMIQLRSLSRTAIAFAMAPFGLIGVIAALLLTNVPMGFVAQLGIIALAGMIIRNAIILIEEVGGKMSHGTQPLDAVADATMHRARPILLTAVAAILGMIPIAPQVFWGPMAFAMIGGLAVATVLTLTVLPAAMLLLLRLEMRMQKMRPTNELPNIPES